MLQIFSRLLRRPGLVPAASTPRLCAITGWRRPLPWSVHPSNLWIPAHRPVSTDSGIPLVVPAAKQLHLAFTCTVCRTRMAKCISHQSYTKGVVLIRCSGCENLHLIADHLGWFQEGKTLEEILAKKNEGKDVAIQQLKVQVKDEMAVAVVNHLMESHPVYLAKILRSSESAAKQSSAKQSEEEMQRDILAYLE